MTRRDAEALVDWLLDSAAAVAYGQISLTVTRHDGKTRLIEKTVSEKEQYHAGAANG